MNLTSSFGREVRFVVIHPVLGQKEVLAYCGLEAKIAAANEWNVPFTEVQDAKVGVEKEALRMFDNGGKKNEA